MKMFGLCHATTTTAVTQTPLRGVGFFCDVPPPWRLNIILWCFRGSALCQTKCSFQGENIILLVCFPLNGTIFSCRCCGLILSSPEPGSRGLGASPDRITVLCLWVQQCNSHSASLRPQVEMVTRKLTRNQTKFWKRRGRECGLPELD